MTPVRIQTHGADLQRVTEKRPVHAMDDEALAAHIADLESSIEELKADIDASEGTPPGWKTNRAARATATAW